MGLRADGGISVLMLLAACGGPGTSPITSPTVSASPPPSVMASATLGPAEPTPFPTARPSSSPDPNGLVVTLHWASDVVMPGTTTVVTGSGLVVWNAGDLRQLRLTPAGVSWVRDRLAETGLLDRSATYGATKRPGAEPPPRGVTGYRFIVPIAGGAATVDTGDPGEYDPAYWVVPEEMRVLGGLAAKMMAADTWIPAGFIAEPTAAYRPAQYLLSVTLFSDGGPPTGAPVDVEEIDWPLPQPVTVFGVPVGPREPGQVTRCGVITAATADAIVAAELKFWLGHDVRAIVSRVRLPWANGKGVAEVTLQQLLPGEHDCSVLFTG